VLIAFLIVLVALAAMVIWLGWVVAHLKNHLSTPPSPTPSTTPTPSSDDVALKMMTTALQAMSTESEATRQMVVDLVQGRPQQMTTGTRETEQTPSELPLIYDYDSTPLSPGIEAVLAREDEETSETLERRRLQMERADLQERMMETQAKLDHDTLVQSSNGSTSESHPRHAAPTDD